MGGKLRYCGQRKIVPFLLSAQCDNLAELELCIEIVGASQQCLSTIYGTNLKEQFISRRCSDQPNKEHRFA